MPMLRERCPIELEERCQVCDERLWLVPGRVGGWYACCHGTADHGSYGRDRFLGWSDAVLRFRRTAAGEVLS